jgi:hypothetical protein
MRHAGAQAVSAVDDVARLRGQAAVSRRHDMARSPNKAAVAVQIGGVACLTRPLQRDGRRENRDLLPF